MNDGGVIAPLFLTTDKPKTTFYKAEYSLYKLCECTPTINHILVEHYKSTRMKKTLLLFSLIFAGLNVHAQTSCSTLSIPEILTNETLVYSDSVGLNIVNSLPAGYQQQGAGTSSPNVEYIFTFDDYYIDQNETPGNRTIIGTSIDGHFTPSQLNRYDAEVEIGSRLKAVTVGYNLTNIKNLVDSLYTARGGNGGNTPCFELIGLVSPNFMTRLSNRGITSGENINNFGDFLTVIEAYNENGELLSLDKVQEIVTELNILSSFLINGCGASLLPICLMYNVDITHDYIVTNKTVNNDLTINTITPTMFNVFPNPIDQDGFEIQFNNTTTEVYVINCINAIGQVVATLQHNESTNSAGVHFETKHLERGIYFVEVVNGNHRSTQKVMVK